MRGFNKRRGTCSRKYGTKMYYYGFKRRPQNKRRILEKKLISFGTFPYALCNLTFTNKLLVKGQNKNLVSLLKKVFHTSFLLKIEIYCKNRGRRSCCLSTMDLYKRDLIS